MLFEKITHCVGKKKIPASLDTRNFGRGYGFPTKRILHKGLFDVILIKRAVIDGSINII